METQTSFELIAQTISDTQRYAASIGKRLRGGEVIDLQSDLGGGKTTFVKGLAAGMGILDVVSSPSFTLRNEYRSNRLTLYHFDFYRLNEPGIMSDELHETIADPSAVTVLEWSAIVSDVLPIHCLHIKIEAFSETGRRFLVTAPKQLTYLLRGIK